uniref:p-granule-associated protein DEPS-1 second OB-fold domain-containing protein n=1 Tax=Parascaris univalens TaxID=6257 RepID=A0A915A379_PARUN
WKHCGETRPLGDEWKGTSKVVQSKRATAFPRFLSISCVTAVCKPTVGADKKGEVSRSFSGEMREGRICGLVVSEPKLVHPYIMQAVFVDKNSPLLFTRCYDLSDRPYGSRVERKYVEKKDKERKLLPGDWIEFGAPIGGYIRDYEKVFPLCENRVVGGKLQVESICVFSPRTENVEVICVSELFGRVAVSIETSERFLANVALKCWLRVEVYRMTVAVTFSECIGVASDQSFVAATVGF